MTNSLTRTLGIATALAVLAFTKPALAQDFGETVSAAIDAIRDARDRNAAPENVKAIFAKASEAEDEGCINFCGFYPGMSEADAQTLATHYGLKDGQWSISATPVTKQVCKITFTLHGIRKLTKGGNTFDDLSQSVANRIGAMKVKRNDEHDLIGYEFKNIDGQTAMLLEKDGLVIVDSWESDLAGNMVFIPGKSYAICKYEVTQQLWTAVMNNNPSTHQGPNYPVEQVTWDDCLRFLNKLNAMPKVIASGLSYRLPTADEWEFACRAGTTGAYCKLSNGQEITESTLGEVAWYSRNSDYKTHAIGQKMPNAFGLYDMHGNVLEWATTSDGFRECLGGCFLTNDYGCRAGYRQREWSRSKRAQEPNYHHDILGFRLAADKISN